MHSILRQGFSKVVVLWASEAIRQSFFAYGVMVSGKIAGFALVLILARFMPLEEYGGFIYARNLIFLLGPIATFGFSHSALKFTSHYKSQNTFELLKGFVYHALLSVFILSLCVTLVGLVFLKLLPHFFLTGFEGAIALAFLGLSGLALLTTFDPIARSLGYTFRAYLPLQFGVPFFTLVGACGLYFFQGTLSAFDMMALFVGFLYSMILIQIILIIMDKKDVFLYEKAHYQRKEWTAFSLPLIFMSASALFSDRGPLLIAGAFLNSEDIGLYGLILALVQMVQMVLFALYGMTSPKLSALISHQHYQEGFSLLQKIRIFSVVGVLFMGGIIYCFTYYILPYFLNNLVPPYRLFFLMLCVPLVTAFLGPVNIMALASERRYLVIQTSILSSFLVIISSFCLIPLYGLIALPLISLIGEIFRLGLLSYLYKKLMRSLL